MGRVVAIIVGILAALLLIGQCVGSEEHPNLSSETKTIVFAINAKDAGGPAPPPRDEGEPVPVPSDPGAAYRLLGWTRMSNGNLEAVTRRTGPSGTSFARREIDCGARTFRYLGEGDTWGEALADSPGPGFMGALTSRSISAYVADFVCGKAGRAG